MRLTAVAAVLALGLTGAQAADLYRNSSNDGADQIANLVYSGVYASVSAGYAFNELTDSVSNGFQAGFQGVIVETRVGADYKFSGSPYYAGAYVQGSYEDAQPASGIWGYGAGLRAGRYFGSTSLYALTGYEGQHVNNGSTDLNGILTGLGTEIAITGHVSLRLEGDYVLFQHPSGSATDENQARFTTGLVLKF